MSKLTRTAKLRSCTVRLSGCQNARETTVFAHAPSIDSGLGYKSPDWWGAFACGQCHTELDKYRSSSVNPYSDRWMSAIFETQKQLFDEGLLIVG